MPERARRGPLLASTKKTLPQGKGMFIRALSHTGSPQDAVARCKWAGVRWVCIQTIWQHPHHDNVINEDSIAAYAGAFRAAGIRVWVWGFPERYWTSRRAEFARVIGDAARTGDADGILLDAEGPWLGASDQDAADLVARVRNESGGGRLVGLTSYGNTDFEIPWSAFAKACDLGVPQVYHGHQKLGLEYQAQSVANYLNHGFKAVVPALAAWDVSGAEMLLVYNATPKPSGAAVWWDWYNANVHGTWPAIRAASATTSR